MPDSPSQPSRSNRAWIIVVSTVVVSLSVVYWFRDVFGPLLLALALAYILEPVVQRAQRSGRGHSRAAVVSVLFLTFGLAVGALIAVLVVQGLALAGSLAGEDGVLARGYERLAALIAEQARNVFQEDWQEHLGLVKEYVSPTAKVLQTVLTSVLGWVSMFGVVLLTPVYLFYLMLDLPRVWAWIREHLPASDRERTLRVLGEVHVAMSAFLRGRVVISLLKGGVTAVGLVLCGTQAAVVIGFAAGILSILPLVGPALGFGIALAVTVASQDGFLPILWISLVFAVAEVLENFVFTPWVMREGVSLHPLTVLFCVMFWGVALGVFGALVAIPLTVVLKIVLREYVLPSVERLANVP